MPSYTSSRTHTKLHPTGFVNNKLFEELNLAFYSQESNGGLRKRACFCPGLTIVLVENPLHPGQRSARYSVPPKC